MMRKWYVFSGLLLMILGFPACEREITLDLPTPGTQLVVEGHIEQGQYPYVILTKNTSFFHGGTLTNYDELFVHDARIEVYDGQKTVLLQEVCLNNIPVQLKPLIKAYLGIDNSSHLSEANICVYISFDMTGKSGRSYKLSIESNIAKVTAQTTIPALPELDSVWTVPHQQFDSLSVLWGALIEPDTLGNYYRYFTKINDDPYYPGYYGSVLSDQFFNGEIFKVNFDRGYAPYTDIDFDTYGLVRSGDTVHLKVAMIDRAHYHFWETFENQVRSGGPFSTPTDIISNIEGGLGIWGGYGSTVDTVIVP